MLKANGHPVPEPMRSRVEDRSRGHSVKCRVAMTCATVHPTLGLPAGACAPLGDPGVVVRVGARGLGVPGSQGRGA